MKATAPQIRAAMSAPSPDIRLYLLHGPDEAGAADLAARLARALGPDVERVDFDGPTLRADPARLADEAASLSLFGGRRYLRATVGDEACEAAQALLDAPRAGSPAVLIAPGLRATSKLVKLAIDARGALAFACYVPNARDAEALAREIAAEHGLRFAGRAAARLAHAATGDRAVMAREVEKLALFLDAAPDRLRELDDAALDAVGADLGEAEADAAIAALVAGRPAALGAELLRLEEAGVAPIAWLRQLGTRLRLLAELRAEIDRGAEPVDAVKRRRLPWPQEATIVAALARWTTPMLTSAIAGASAAERQQRSANAIGEVLASTWALEAARGLEARR